MPALLLQLEDFFDLFAEGAGDFDGQRRRVAALLGGDDRLPRDANLIGHGHDTNLRGLFPK